MTFTPPAFVAMLPPIVLDPLDAKSTGQTNPAASQCWCTASVTAPASTCTVPPSLSTSHILRMRESESTSSPRAATAPPARPVRPPEGTTATPSLDAIASTLATSAVDRGNTAADGDGAYTRVQSRPTSASSAGSVVTASAPIASRT